MREEHGDIVIMPAMMGKPELVFAYDVEGVIKLIRHRHQNATALLYSIFSVKIFDQTSSNRNSGVWQLRVERNGIKQDLS